MADFQVTMPGNRLISVYYYPEIAMKKTLLREYLRKNENNFENILGGYSQPEILLIHEKKPEIKNLMQCSVPLKLQ